MQGERGHNAHVFSHIIIADMAGYACVRICACLEIQVTLEIYVYTCVPISALLEVEVTAEMADPHPTRLIVAST